MSPYDYTQGTYKSLVWIGLYIQRGGRGDGGLYTGVGWDGVYARDYVIRYFAFQRLKVEYFSRTPLLNYVTRVCRYTDYI